MPSFPSALSVTSMRKWPLALRAVVEEMTAAAPVIFPRRPRTATFVASVLVEEDLGGRVND